MAKVTKRMKAAIGRHSGRGPVSLPDTPWDMGQQTAAQNAGKVIEDAKIWDEDKGQWVNPNNVKRARRIDLIEHYHNKGVIGKAEFLAAQKMAAAWEGTQRSPDAIKKVQVDTSPKPDAAVAIQIDRLSRFHRIAKHIPASDWPIIECVVLRNATPANIGYRGPRYILGIEWLQRALKEFADKLD